MNENDVKATGLVYRTIAGLVERYYPKREFNFMVSDIFRTALREAGNKCKQENDAFPSNFYAKMANVAGHWFSDGQIGFAGVQDHEIKPFFMDLWKYHKKYIGQPQTDSVWDEIWKEGNELASGKDENLRPFIIIVMKDLERRNPKTAGG